MRILAQITMSGIHRILLMKLDQFAIIVIDFLDKADRIFIRIYNFNITTKAKVPAGTFAPITSATIS
jgi:hypothetical protein